jgi:hypothetical protein
MYRYDCKVGFYESDSLFGLIWVMLTHRFWHLRKHGKWMD